MGCNIEMSKANKSADTKANKSAKPEASATPTPTPTPAPAESAKPYAEGLINLTANLNLLSEKYGEKFSVKLFAWQEADKKAFDALQGLGMSEQANLIEQAARAKHEKENPSPTVETVRPWFDREVYSLMLATGLRRAYAKSADADATLSLKAEEDLRVIIRDKRPWDADALASLYKVSAEKIREFMKANQSAK
jgi:hypothetical protein